MKPIDVKEWLLQLSHGHTFGRHSSVYGNNRNLVIYLKEPVRVRMTNGAIYVFEAGRRLGIFHKYEDNGHEIAATVFRDDDEVNIYQGGKAVVKRYLVEHFRSTNRSSMAMLAFN